MNSSIKLSRFLIVETMNRSKLKINKPQINGIFMRHLIQLAKEKLTSPQISTRPIEEHLRAAADWLLLAQQATPDDGVAHSYDIRKKKWLASYPETTGYAIPTLYEYATHFNAPQYAAAATRMAIWESEIQLADGGVRAGNMDAEIIAPTIFNTGQVLFGWAKAWQETGDDYFLGWLLGLKLFDRARNGVGEPME